MNTRIFCVLLVAACFALLRPGPSRADVVLNGHSLVNGGAALNSTPAISSSGGNGSVTNPWLYAVGDHLAMGAYRISTDTGMSFRLDLNGHALTGTSGFTNLNTVSTVSRVQSGSVYITNAASVGLGVVDISSSGFQSRPGTLFIGGAGSPVGGVRMDSLVAMDTSNQGYGAGTRLILYSTGDVWIATSGGMPGDILTYGNTSYGGDIEVNHRGSFVARDIDVRNYGNYHSYQRGGYLFFAGNYGGSGNGSFRARHIDAGNACNYPSYCDVGAINIQGYASVLVTGNLLATNVAGSYGGGNISITNITGDLEVDGVINSYSVRGSAYAGSLKLSAGGKIMLMSALNLANFSSVTLAPGAKAYIDGALQGFPTGNPASGLLDAPSGATIYYRPAVSGNAYLGRSVYILKSGGRLTVYPQGTVVTFR